MGGFGSCTSTWAFLWSQLVKRMYLWCPGAKVTEKMVTLTQFECHRWRAATFSPLCWLKVYLLEDKVDGAPGVDVHKVNFSVVIDELCAPRHSVRKAALNLQRQCRLQNQGLNQCVKKSANCNCRSKAMQLYSEVFRYTIMRSPGHQIYLHFHAVSVGPTLTAAPAGGLCT